MSKCFRFRQLGFVAKHRVHRLTCLKHASNGRFRMSIRVDHERRIVFSSYSGVVAAATVAERRRQIEALNVPDYREIVDLTNVTEVHIGADALARTAKNGPPIVGRGTVRIIVAPSDWLYEIARTFAALSAGGLNSFMIVRSMQQAEEFLEWSEK